MCRKAIVTAKDVVSLTGIGEDIEDFLGRKLSELESSFLCEQC